MQDGNFNTNYTITESGSANVEQAFRAINSAIQQSAKSVESLKSVSVSLSKTEFFPAWREGLNNISLLSERMKSLSEGFNTANVGSAAWANFNSELRKSQREMQLIHMMAAEMFDPIANSTSTVINSLSALTQKIAYMRNELMNIDKSTPAFAALQNKIAMTEAELAKFNMVVSATTKRTGDYNMVGINTARLFSDMGYAAQSFSFGVMSIGNNISPLVESLQRARTAGQSWKDILVSTFSGTSGWLVGINMAVSAITAWSIWNRNAKDAVDEHRKSIDQLKSSMGGVIEIKTEFKDVVYGIPGKDLDVVIQALESKIKKLEGVDFTKKNVFSLANRTDKESVDLAKEKSAEAFLSAKADADRITNNNKLLEVLKEQLATYRAQRDAADILESLGRKSEPRNPKKDKLDKPSASPHIEEEYDYNKYAQEIMKLRGIDYDLYKQEMEKERDLNQQETDQFFKDRKAYEDKFLEYKNLAIQDPYIREKMIARKQAGDLLNIYQDMFDRRSISEQELKDVRLLIEEDYTRKASDIEAKIDKQRVQVYRSLLTEFGRLGSNLRTIFKGAGDSFVDSLLEALQIAQAIAEIIQSIETISSIFKTIGTVATVATTGVPIPSMVGGGTTSQPMQEHNYNVNIGGTTVARLTASGYKLATSLRYMN